jgi:molecular chaperone GrpE (heat shock protein)
MYKRHSRNSKTTEIKNMGRHEDKQKTRIYGATENTINREINELKTKIENIKEEVTHDIENLRKKNETEIQNTMKATPAN